MGREQATLATGEKRGTRKVKVVYASEQIYENSHEILQTEDISAANYKWSDEELSEHIIDGILSLIMLSLLRLTWTMVVRLDVDMSV